MEQLNFERIGKRIRDIRLTKSLTQENLADAVGVNTSHISNIENGRVKISLTALVHVCNALDTTVDNILFGEYSNEHSCLDTELINQFHNHNIVMQEKIIEIIKILK